MDSPLNTAVSFQNPLGIQQPVQAAVHRKSRELPFDNPGEPYQSTHVKKRMGRKHSSASRISKPASRNFPDAISRYCSGNGSSGLPHSSSNMKLSNTNVVKRKAAKAPKVFFSGWYGIPTLFGVWCFPYSKNTLIVNGESHHNGRKPQ